MRTHTRTTKRRVVASFRSSCSATKLLGKMHESRRLSICSERDLHRIRLKRECREEFLNNMYERCREEFLKNIHQKYWIVTWVKLVWEKHAIQGIVRACHQMCSCEMRWQTNAYLLCVWDSPEYPRIYYVPLWDALTDGWIFTMRLNFTQNSLTQTG